MFEEADIHRNQLIEKVDGLEREIESQKLQIEECEFDIRVQKKEADQLKEDLLKADKKREKAEEKTMALDREVQALDGFLMQSKAKNEEDEATIEKLNGIIRNLKIDVSRLEKANEDKAETIRLREMQIRDMENTIQSQEKTIESNGAAIERLTKKTMDGTKVEDDLREKL